jgi:maltose 6'-phosphate phosphatase
MNRFGKNSRLFVSALFFLFLILPVFIAYHNKSIAQETEADNIKSINLLTINLLFSEVDDRNKRLRAIADYVAVNQVDVLLLQEVVGGELVNTENSAEDLKDLLRDEYNLNYFLRTAFEVGVPGLLSTANAILSRFEIEFRDSHRLPWVTEEEFLGFKVKLPRNVILTRLLIPDFGEVDIFNTHLCARCSSSDREDQLDEVLGFIQKFQNDAGAPRPTVLGGDMNFDLFANNGDERFLYDKVLLAGFSDAYANFIIAAERGRETLETLCENKNNADEHCTVGVSDLNGSNARRIDYLFARDFGPPVKSQVVFNPNAPNGVPPTVSDHAAVVADLLLRFVAFVSPNAGCNGKSPCYSSINNALSDVASGTEVRVEAATYNEDVILTTNKIVTLTGGWNSAFDQQIGSSTIQTLTIEKGSVTVDNIILLN